MSLTVVAARNAKPREKPYQLTLRVMRPIPASITTIETVREEDICGSDYQYT